MTENETNDFLRQSDGDRIPHYEKDDGSLNDDQLQSIRDTCSATNIPDSHFTERLCVS